MKQRLHESLEAKLAFTQSSINVDNLFQVWGSERYGNLSVLLAFTRALAMIHQQHHWLSGGSDHLLFGKLYEDTFEEVDVIAEKSVMLGANTTIDLTQQFKTMYSFIKDNTLNITMGVSGEALVKCSLEMEFKFLTLANMISENLGGAGLLTNGLDNMISGMCDTHETHVFLLKQRLNER
jgi:DNA-binding ferritin-like protein